MAAQEQEHQKRVCVTGAGGFIGAHLAARLKEEGCYVVAVDRKDHEFRDHNEFCHKFIKADLRSLKACLEATKDCDEVYNLAADMGGMGFIQSNEAVLMLNNTLISANVLEASRRNKVPRYFYSSSACCYNESHQEDPDNQGLKESDAWPAQPQDTYGLEKLYAEEMAKVYGRDFNMETRIARFHNIYGPYGTWRGGREKAPAAFCRKAATAALSGLNKLQVWGDGKQTRSFCYVDDCVEGILRLMRSDCREPLNLGSDEMVTINQLCELALSYDGTNGEIEHIKGPTGVRGRNSDNTLIKQKLGWAPSIPLKDGLRKTYSWIKSEVEKAQNEEGLSAAELAKSVVVQQSETDLDDIVV